MLNRRTIAAAVTFVIAATILAIIGPSPAAAQNGSCSGIDRNGTECRISAGVAPSAPAPGTTSLRAVTGPQPYFRWLRYGTVCEVGGGSTPTADIGSVIFDLNALNAAGPPANPGVLWVAELFEADGTRTNSGFVSCTPDDADQPPAPPPLPTADEIWGAALTFEPTVNTDPFVRGLTGLETYFWYEGPTADAVTITLNGYSVSATIQAEEFTWDTGAESRDGGQLYVSAAPGSADAPAAEHTYALPDDVVIVHEITWSGSATIGGPGLPPGGIGVDLGVATLSTARAYDVIEIRAPLVRDD
ncbi:MAG: hypothetical protein AAF467_03460 [Actinomycetota bacterium]